MTEALFALTHSIDGIQAGLGKLMPELVLTLFFLLTIVTDLLIPRNQVKYLYPFALLGITTATLLYVIAIFNPAHYVAKSYFLDLLTNDGIAFYAALLICISGILAVFLSIFSKPIQKRPDGHGEYLAKLLVLLVGLNLLVKSQNLLMLFVSLELVSIASYLLTLTYRDKKQAVEAGLKYILLGALASGVMVYGMSFLYGFTGTLQFTSPEFLSGLLAIHPMVVLAVFALVLAGFLFKIAAAPFHFWAPDVYEGAPTPVVAFFAAAPKVAGIVVLFRFILVFRESTFFDRFSEIGLFLAAIALLTLVVGNFTALLQERAKRMMAFSSISQAGFLLVAILAIGGFSLHSLFFYLTVLVFTNFGIFFVIQIFEERIGELTPISAYSGLGRTYPFVSIMAVLFLISLTGLPPTAGFNAKLFIFTAIWQTYQQTGNNILLLLFSAGLMFTAVAVFYYVRLPYYLFVKRNLSDQKVVVPLNEKLLLVCLGIPVLLFFFKADWLMSFIETLIQIQI